VRSKRQREVIAHLRSAWVVICIASVGAACERKPLMVGGGSDAGFDGVETGDAGDAHETGSQCSLRITVDPNNPFGPPPQCVDGKDNDDDGLIDYADPDCTSFSDNDESSFAIRTATDEEDFFCNRDCFFDGNLSRGDDMCSGWLVCDPLNPGAATCPYRPDASCPDVPDMCRETCLPRTPNGCDCFGCCALARNGASTTVLLSTRCDAAHLDDPTRCPPCTQQPSCLNPCEPCEVCFGKTAPDPGCWPAQSPHDVAPPGQCASGVTACGPGGVDPCACPAGTYCVTGCCMPI
jgi:hypothetical protein